MTENTAETREIAANISVISGLSEKNDESSATTRDNAEEMLRLADQLNRMVENIRAEATGESDELPGERKAG